MINMAPGDPDVVSGQLEQALAVHEPGREDLPPYPISAPLRKDPRLQRPIARARPREPRRGAASPLVKPAREARNLDCRRGILVPLSWATKNLA